ncbi:unnamed protein product [Allacma fusca]|uniref:Uncharacterized protein n=1 Tax=Allacma fusca TaxID=39272 RepID=A0A8J2KFC5_9HEXA|nr:unnamed protein product [Allacma fusca]
MLPAILPADLSSCPFTIVVSITAEMFLIFHNTAAHFFCSYVILGYALPHMVHDILECVDIRLKTETPNHRNLTSTCKDLVLASLEIRFYNHTYSSTNYVVKMIWLLISIAGIFVGIRCWHVSLGLSISMLSFGIDGIVIFTLFMGRAYEVPEKVQQLKLSLLSKTGKLPLNERIYLQRVVKRIPTCGIRAGSFYTLDRSTTPTFVHYVIAQVCGLLVLF